MSVLISPKAQFLAKEEASRKFRAIVVDPSMQEAVTAAIAEFVMCYAPTSEQIKGVNEFVSVLVNIGEKAEPTRQFPTKSLHWAEEPVKGVKK